MPFCVVPVSDLGHVWEKEDGEENLNGTWSNLFSKRKIAEGTVTSLAESISWCERKQGGERKCKQILMLHLRSGYNIKFLGSPLLTSSPLPLMFLRCLGDRLASSFSSIYFCQSGLVSGCVKIVSPLCLWEAGGCDLKEPSCKYCSEQTER